MPAETGRTPGRWWLAIVVVSLAVAVLLWTMMRGGEEQNSTTGAGVPAGREATSAVREYIRFAGTARDRLTPESGADPEYVVEGLRKLAGALGTLGIGSPDLQIDLRAAAEHILLNPSSTATAAVVRSRLIAVARAIDARRQNESDLQPLAEAIREGRTILEEETALRQFFSETALVLEGLSPTS